VIADAVVVLGGHGARAAVGRQLVRDGAARALVLSSGCPSESGGPVDALRFTPVPFNTRGEARAVAQLVREQGWRSLIVVTSGYHVRRARLLFERAVPAEIRFVAAPYPLLLVPAALVKEAAKLAYAVTVGRAP
jgi:uncharacterized SAM-binding protein YcdF (DUF218 family)